MSNATRNVRNKNRLILISIIVLALIIRILFYTGIGTSDSMAYTEYANNYKVGKLTYNSGHSPFRIGILIPVSILYNLFGVNEFTSNILILLISLGMIILAYSTGKLLFNEKTGLLASLFPLFF